MAAKKFDWLDMMSKQLAIFINVSVEAPAQQTLMKLGTLDDLENLLKQCKTSDKLQREILDRCFNLLSKMLRTTEAAVAVAKQKHTVFKAVLYFHKEFAGELQMNALRVLHPLCRVPGFREICLNEHKFTPSTFDNYVKEVQLLFKQSLQTSNKEDWVMYTNACSSMVAFVDAFPERLKEFQPIIKDLIFVMKEKTEVVRKNSAMLLARLAKDEGNSKFMRANHGYDVLMSLRG